MDRVSGREAEVIMHEQSGAFALDRQKKITGRITMAQHGQKTAVRFEADNLKPYDPRRYRYSLLALGLDKGRSLHKMLGSIQADRSGKAEMETVLESDDTGGKADGISIYSIFMVAAVSQINKNEPYHPVLKGDWDGKWTDVKREVENMPANYNGFYTEYVKEMAGRLVAKKDSFRKTVPFEEAWLAEKWWRAEQPSDFPVASVTAEEQIRKYGHFIMSFNDEYVILGVPGTGTEDDQPDGGASGFRLWHHVKGSREYGYWMALIQRNTGLIAEIS